MRSLFSGIWGCRRDRHDTILVMMAVLVVLGTFMEWIAIVFITVPVFAPVVVGLTPNLATEFGMAVCSAELKTGCLNEYWVAVWFGMCCS